MLLCMSVLCTFLLLSNTPVYRTPHFVYPYTNGCTFELFPVLSIINKTTINIYIQMFEHKFSFFLGKYLQVGSLGCGVSIHLTS